MKFTKSFYGCKKGHIYPTRFKAGDECPPELLRAARSSGAVGSKKGRENDSGQAGNDKSGAENPVGGADGNPGA